MRIGLFGNTNNVPYYLAEGLRALGVDVRLIVTSKYHLHRPESINMEFKQGYPYWIRDFSDIPFEEYLSPTLRVAEVVNALISKADALVLNDLGPSLLEFCDTPAISYLTGSDITYYADYGTIGKISETWSTEFVQSPTGRFHIKIWEKFLGRQRDGIRNSRYVDAIYDGIVPEYDKIFSEIGVDPTKRMTNCISSLVCEKGEQRKNSRIRILSGSRVNWVRPLPSAFCSLDDKGTDKLLYAFRQILDSRNDVELLLVRKGLDLEKTERLIKVLGIDSNVVWLDEMSTDRFQGEMAKADIVIDNFGLFPGLITWDAMAMGKPVVGNVPDGAWASSYPEAIPICSASTIEQIAVQLENLMTSESFRAEMGELGRQFVNTYCSPKAVAKVYMKKFESL